MNLHHTPSYTIQMHLYNKTHKWIPETVNGRNYCYKLPKEFCVADCHASYIYSNM